MRIPRYRVEVDSVRDGEGWDGYVLKVIRDGKELWRANDAGEPEDNLFVRDYSWVKPALEEAYRLGLEDGLADHASRIAQLERIKTAAQEVASGYPHMNPRLEAVLLESEK